MKKRPAQRALLRNEFALREYLSDDWAIRPVASTQYHGRFALVLCPPFRLCC
ncbi:Uncharacterised protein [Leclercia adecarboxylata]|uniref:Uncharacterized protein n=1 Tax=Leclercia adecarboxylata TaxID=83655 RepID=A0A4U9HJI3_9ENTR|nr:Uncharacterised protein [Leclercia adecarboxylata]